ncbi:MAG: hypothetical protein ACI85I_002008 [Arenicella sp.]|jgi:hypothetical protein
MKKSINFIVLFFIGLSAVFGQHKHDETIKKTIPISTQNILILDNVFGSITVEGYDGSEIILEAKKTIHSKYKEDFEKGKSELELMVNAKSEYIDIFIKSPQSTRTTRFEDGKFHKEQHWVGDTKYSFNFDFVLKVPKNMNLEVSTINDGNVVISNMNSEYIEANNVNGQVTLENIAKARTNARTINGKITASFSGNPDKDSSFSTINGDINITLKKSLSAKLLFRSMQGEFYTDFEVKPITNSQPVKSESKSSKMIFKLENATAVQVGSGEVEYKFNTLNGDVYVKKS